MIDGLTKQGGPIKSTLTTSLGHRYLAKDDPGTRSKSHQSGDPHTPLDELQVTMVEATDDSYLFASTPKTLARFCLEMERFQYWLTQWTKTNAYVINPTGDVPKIIKMPSITLQEGVDPWMATNHDVLLSEDSRSGT